MYSKKSSSILSSRELRLLLVFCFTLLSVMGILTEGTGPRSAHAASASVDPLVVIATDLTSPSCITTRVIKSHTTHALLSKTQAHCPPGTDIGTVSVPLSLAKAQHETYVPSLPAHVSSSMRVKWSGQIQQLMDAKRQALQASTLHRMSPNSCGYDEGIYTSSSFFGTWIGFEVYYHLSLNCSSVTLNREEVIGYTPVNSPAYWIKVMYSYYDQTCPVHYNYVGANDLNSYLGVTEPAGLYNIWRIDSGNACFSVAGASQDFSVGPLN